MTEIPLVEQLITPANPAASHTKKDKQKQYFSETSQFPLLSKIFN
jgi:hypothetical protein